MKTYVGHCHCGAVRFTFRCEPITRGLRCNCSICIRKGAVMSEVYFSPEDFSLEGHDSLSLYRFGDRMVNNWFCRTCGVYPFHDTTVHPGHYRVNLGCVEGVDPLALAVRLIDGRSF
jgi:hypothetical protein